MIEGTKVWIYTMQGVVPPAIQAQHMEAFVRAAVNWNDAILACVRGSQVTIRDLTPGESARLPGQ